jgi:NAD(P)-dependent dehydrogenase (short-subunit alcohol dehydrogenase family)
VRSGRLTDAGSVYEWPSALITGAGSGLGRALTSELVAAGIDVWALGRRSTTLDETKAACAEGPGVVRTLTCDVSDPDDVRAAFDWMGSEVPGILVNCAGRAHIEAAEDISARRWRAVGSVTLDGTFYVSSAWGRARLGLGGGVALNITSATVGGGSASTAHSGAAKAGVESLTRSLAVEWGPRGIRVNAVAPGPFITEAAERLGWSDEDRLAYVSRDIPLRRVARIEEVVDPSLFLISRKAGFINGEVLKVDGGWTLNGWLYMAEDDVPRTHEHVQGR